MYGILKKSLFISMAGTLLAATSCQMTPKMSEKECVTKNVYENVPFYRKKMVEKGVTPDDIKSLKDISKLPFLTKDDLRDAYPYGT